MEEWLVVRRSVGTRARGWARADIMAARDIPVGVATGMEAAPGPSGAPAIVRVEAANGADLDDPQGIAIATRPMPLALVEPFDRMAAGLAAPLLAAAKTSGKTWGLETLGVDPDRHDGKGVTVAVIDTGITRTHPAFRHLSDGAIVDVDFTVKPGGVPGAADSDGHGTHCAGTICGDVVDGIRIGVAPHISRLLIAKAIGGQRGATALLEALDWAVTNRADVISMSLGFDFVGYQSALMTNQAYGLAPATSMALTAFRDNIRVFDSWMALLARRRAEGFDPIIVAASGNQSNRPRYVVEKSSPSAADNIISVGAVDKTLGIAPFSNTNPNFVGPGVDVISADTSAGLAVMSGTSMACPHIAGLAALYWQVARSGGQGTSKRVLRMMEASAEKHRAAAPVFSDVGDGMPYAPTV